MNQPGMELLDVLADTGTVSSTLARQAIIRAVNIAADDHLGRVTAAWVRPHLPAWVRPNQVGAVMSALARPDKNGHRWLYHTREVHESGNTQQRNGTRLMPVYHRPEPIPQKEGTTP